VATQWEPHLVEPQHPVKLSSIAFQHQLHQSAKGHLRPQQQARTSHHKPCTISADSRPTT
jgi:hypothetical protein